MVWSSIILGFMTSSWWVALAVLFILGVMPHNDETVGVVSNIWGLTWATIAAIAFFGAFGLGAAIFAGLVAFSISWVPMRASEQYWRDLEKDGGPYSD
jgi:hypothetical protein